MTWHPRTDTIDAYAGGRIDDASASSVESHVLACATCRGTLSTRSDDARLERIWDELRDRVDRPRPGRVERALIHLRVPAHDARLLVATTSLRASWLLAVTASLAFAVAASRAVTGTPLPFLVLAPLIPLSGIATAFGRQADPVWEIGVASPMGAFRLMLIRAIAVLAVSAALVGLAALALPHLGWDAAAWLLPSLALTVFTLAVSTSVSAKSAAAGVSLGWLLLVLVADRLSDTSLVAFGPTAQVAFAIFAAVSGVVLASRRQPFERQL
jgi:hypothetical protein